MERRTRNRKDDEDRRGSDEWRGRFVLFCFVAVFMVLFMRAVDLQVLDRDFLTSEGEKRAVRAIEVPGGRGAIRDRRGNALALSAPVESVWAVPSAAMSAPDKLPKLAKKLGVKTSVLRKSLASHDDKTFLYLRRQMNPADAREITD